MQTFVNRRTVLAGLPLAALAPRPAAAADTIKRNPAFDLPGVTSQKTVTSYNNFYEFGSHKDIADAAQRFQVSPWRVRIDGLVSQERDIDLDDLLARMPLEERVYRLRCVEAWSMVVPWVGFPFSALLKFAEPLSSAAWVRMETLMAPEQMPGLRQSWYPWPYVEGLSMAEAANELSFLAIGMYGSRTLPPQNGAALRLVVPWKYGFKSIKSIARLTFVERRPTTFWMKVAGNEYGFWANVNPEVPHRRWSQASERDVETGLRKPTLPFNGYGQYVAGLYRGMDASEPLYM